MPFLGFLLLFRNLDKYLVSKILIKHLRYGFDDLDVWYTDQIGGEDCLIYFKENFVKNFGALILV